jgi:hypothetical protein
VHYFRGQECAAVFVLWDIYGEKGDLKNGKRIQNLKQNLVYLEYNGIDTVNCA